MVYVCLGNVLHQSVDSDGVRASDGS